MATNVIEAVIYARRTLFVAMSSHYSTALESERGIPDASNRRPDLP